MCDHSKLNEIQSNTSGNVNNDNEEQLISDSESVCETFALGQGVVVKTEKFDDNTYGLVTPAQNNALLQKLTRICRCCLIERNGLKSLFDESNSGLSMMLLLTSVQIAQNDGLPPNICEECLDHLTKAVQFKQQILNADMSLRHYIAVGYADASELQVMDFEQFGRTMSDNVTIKMENVDRNYHVQNMSLEKENNQPIDYLPVQKIENFETVITSSNTEHDDKSYQPDSIKVEIIEQISDNDEPEEIHLEAETKQIFVKKNRISSKKNNIQPIDFFFVQKTENTYSIIMNPNTGKNLKQNYDQHNQNVQEREIVRMKIIDQHEETSDELHKGVELKKQIIVKDVKEDKNKKFKKLFRLRLRNEKNDSVKSSLKGHLRSSRETILKREIPKSSFPCDKCEISFTNESDLYVHGSIHVTNDKFVCRKCEKEFEDCGLLKRHVTKHFKDKLFTCKVCNQGFQLMNNLKIHFRKHGKLHACSICEKSYYDQSSLSIHYRTHTGEKPFVCNTCGKAFAESRLLTSHLMTHSDQKKYACDQCGKKFNHLSAVVLHIRAHTGEKPFSCNICNKKFACSWYLKLHMRIHSDERQFPCEWCSKKFTTSGNLARHVRVHTGEKPYTCIICEKAFRQRSHLKTHMSAHSG